ncbi:hypothetical protein BKI52_18955 [marine bacterium AO1-C]|nr:hypothetical protein BKI52_18955 [marine bacterium AO1-C]
MITPTIDFNIETLGILSTEEQQQIAVMAQEHNYYCFIYAINKWCFEQVEERIQEVAVIRDSSEASKIFRLSTQNFLGKFRELIFPTIAFEYNLLKKAGELEEGQEFVFFLQHISNDVEWIAYFFAKYPVLVSIIEKVTRFMLDFNEQLTQRCIQDQAILEQKFGIRDFKIASVESFDGDFHNGWETTAKLRFVDGTTLFYKPRDGQNELFFQAFNGFCESLGATSTMGQISIVSREGYCWMEEIKPAPVTLKEEVKQFFWKQGANLAMFYFLGASDLIADNLIVRQNTPYYFDLEVLLKPHMTEGLDEHLYEARNEATKFIDDSVLGVNLLPQYGFVTKDFQGVSNAGLSFSKKSLPQLMVSFDGDGFKRDTQPVMLNEANLHLPLLNGERIGVEEYVEDIMAGFKDRYQFILNHRQALIDYLSNITPQKTRVLYRPSYVYGKLFLESFQPKYLSSFERWKTLFNYLHEADDDLRGNQAVVNSEVQQMQDLDIPVFYTYSNSQHLYAQGEMLLENFFPKTGQEEALNRLKQASNEDLARQIKLIELSFAIHENYQDKNIQIVQPFPLFEQSHQQVNLDAFLEEALHIEQKLADKALLDKEQTPAYWGLTQTPNSTWAIRPRHWGFFDGLDGISLFYLNLYLVTGKSSFREVGERFLCAGIEQFEQYHSFYQNIDSFNKVSLFNYPISTFYLAEIFEEANIPLKFLTKRATETLLDWIEYNYQYDQDFDLISGGAGTLLYLNKLYQRTQNPRIPKLASNIGDYLLTQAKTFENGHYWPSIYGKAFTGWSHGSAGMAYAFFVLYDLAKEVRFQQAAQKSLAFERQMFDSEKQYWYYFLWHESQEIEKMENHYWAYGSGGTLLSRVLIKRFFQDEHLDEEIKIAQRNIMSKGPYVNHNYSSGLFGNLDTLSILAQEDTQLKQQLLTSVTQLLHQKKVHQTWVCAPVGAKNNLMELDGFFSGIAGIGNTLLNLAFADQTKSLF